MSKLYDRESAKNEIKADIELISKSILSSDIDRLKEIHIHIDGKYQTVISNWGMSMNWYNPNFGFDYDELDIDTIKQNLMIMKAKLEGYSLILNGNLPTIYPEKDIKTESGMTLQISNNNNNTNTNTNTNSTAFNLSFDEARQKVEDMTALSREQTDEILEKINEIENISKEKTNKKTKWEKIKPILAFALDKGVDIAVMLWSLALQAGM